MDLTQLFERHASVAAPWSVATRAHYATFTEHLAQGDLLTITVGKGGLSYYQPTTGGRVFVCHFNATPRSGAGDIGFVDYRQDVLSPLLDTSALVADLEVALGVEIKVGKVWCSMHSPLARSAEVADAFRLHLCSKLR